MTAPSSHGEPSFLAATLRVAGKELLASFRDRQTTLYTLVLPIVLYPFLFWCLIQGSLFVEGRHETTEVVVGVAAPDAALVPRGLEQGLERDPRPGPEASGARTPGHEIDRVDVLPPRVPMSEEEARTWLRAGDRGAAPDAILYIARDTAGEPAGARLLYDSTFAASGIARSRVRQRLPAYVRDLRRGAALEADPSTGSLEPFRREPARNVAPQPAIGAYLLSHVLPVLFVLMTVMGAFFPAVDLTCGERERRTAETTLLLPVPRTAVHMGKILAVCTAALIATGLNVSALALSAGHLLSMLPSGSVVEVHLPIAAMAKVAPLLLLFAFFVSSILTGVAALARTFKEGQALLGPVQVLFVLPGLAAALPGVQLTPVLASVPVVNVVLAFRSLLRGDEMPLEYAVTAVSLACLSIAAIGLSLWMLSRESLLFGEGGSPLRALAGLMRSSRGAR